jgi:hypothetical protein
VAPRRVRPGRDCFQVAVEPARGQIVNGEITDSGLESSPEVIDLIVHEFSDVPRKIVVSINQRHLLEKADGGLEALLKG